jgi:hypothetical protein
MGRPTGIVRGPADVDFDETGQATPYVDSDGFLRLHVVESGRWGEPRDATAEVAEHDAAGLAADIEACRAEVRRRRRQVLVDTLALLDAGDDTILPGDLCARLRSSFPDRYDELLDGLGPVAHLGTVPAGGSYDRDDLTAALAVVDDELLVGPDPLDCPACVEQGDACAYHDGFGAGWDACAAFFAQHVEGEAAAAVAWLSPGADLDEAEGWDR